MRFSYTENKQNITPLTLSIRQNSEIFFKIDLPFSELNPVPGG
jgi:hypothetical protein